MSRVRPREAPSSHGRRPGPPPLGVRDLHVSPGPSSVHACTPTGGSGAVARHHYRWCMQGPPNATASSTMHQQQPARSSQDDRHDLRRTKDDIQDDCDARRLPTVYFLQCLTTVPPRFRGKRRLLGPHSCTPPLLVTIKGGGGLPLAGLWFFSSSKDAQTPPDVIHHHLRSGIPIRHVQPLF